ncbi:hypothetical protein LPJ72_004994 [Coemansia sp. Benny D160-2]|nr:hypothetical protein LPJ72_004994 [Coemansia sp. Benny D160-2]
MSPEVDTNHTEGGRAVEEPLPPLPAPREKQDNMADKGGGGSAPERTYAAIAAGSAPPPVSAAAAVADTTSHFPDKKDSGEENEDEDEYTTDSYTEDTEMEDEGAEASEIDEFAEESVFSDSNYDAGSQRQSHGRSSRSNSVASSQASWHNSQQQKQQKTQPNHVAEREAAAAAAVSALETHFSSGATSPAPNPVDGLNTTRAANALGAAHRFVSQTPWGVSTGRLTRDQRHRAQLWDDAGNSGRENGKANPQAPAAAAPAPALAPAAMAGYAGEAPMRTDGTQKTARVVTVAQFVGAVVRLGRIGFPGAACTESRLLAALGAVLAARTALDVWFAGFNARTVRAVVTYDRATLVRRLLPEYVGMAAAMAGVNQAIKWTMSSLTVALRVRLGRHAHARYVDGVTHMAWTQGQPQMQGHTQGMPPLDRADWLLTVQIHRFADMLPRLVAGVVKPAMDWVVFTRLLSRFVGRGGSAAMVLYVVLANLVVRLSSPPTGRHASRLAQLEDAYRGVYARVSSTIRSAAAAARPLVSRPDAADADTANLAAADPAGAFVPRVHAAFRLRARAALDAALDRVAASVVAGNIRRFFGGIGESLLVKYGATLTAYYLLSRPLCMPGRRLASEILHDPAAVMLSYSRNSAYLINLSQATTRLLLVVADLPKFVWAAVNVDRLLRSLDVHAAGGYRASFSDDGDDALSR